MRAFVLPALFLLASTALAQDGGVPAAVELLEEAQLVLQVQGIQRIAIGDPGIADVKTIGGDEVLVIGGEAGKTTLVVWRKDGSRHEVLITVKRGQREAVDVEAVELANGEIKTLKATGLTAVTVGDPKVVEASLRSGQLQLRALAPGRSDVVLARKAGDVNLVVEVGAVMTLTGVQLKTGGAVVLMIDRATGATSTNPAICEAKVPSTGRVSLRGLKPGKTSIEVIVAGLALILPVEVER